MLALTVHHSKLVADCNFVDINLAFAGKSISVLKIQFHKKVQPLVFSSLPNYQALLIDDINDIKEINE